jgi:hypothetical protein
LRTRDEAPGVIAQKGIVLVLHGAAPLVIPERGPDGGWDGRRLDHVGDVGVAWVGPKDPILSPGHHQMGWGPRKGRR